MLIVWGCSPSSMDSSDSTTDQILDMEHILVGTYTKQEGHVEGKAAGVYHFSFQPDSAKLQLEGVTEGLINPSYLAIHPSRQYVYVVNETGPDVDTVAQITAYKLDDATATLERINAQPTAAFAPCYVSVDHDGKYVMVANYVGGTIVMYPIQENGGLGTACEIKRLEGKGAHPEQEASHPHAIIPSPNNKYVYVPDKGTDKIMIYEFRENRLIPGYPASVSVQAGAGPRHMVFHPRQNYAYVINELDASINAFAYQPETGTIAEQQRISTLPTDYQGQNSCADIHLTSDGRFLYASNRGHNSIAIYSVDPSSGLLTLMGHESTRGEVPRNFMIDKSSRWLLVANQNSDNIVIFSIDAKTGLLQYKDEIACKTPVCLKQI
jgi:6-phosphogluconolactonase